MRSHLRIKRDRVSFLKKMTALGAHCELITSSGDDTFQRSMPDSIVAGIQPVSAGRPSIPIADDRNFSRIWRPYGKADSAGNQMSAAVTIKRRRIGRQVKRIDRS